MPRDMVVFVLRVARRAGVDPVQGNSPPVGVSDYPLLAAAKRMLVPAD